MGFVKTVQHAFGFGQEEEIAREPQGIMPLLWEGKSIRYVMMAGAPWWVAMDVCKALGLSNITEALRGLRDDQKRYFSNPEVSIGTPNLILINESGLFRLIFKSRKEEAIRFQEWVTDKVLPAIRKYGYYVVKDRAGVFEKTKKMDRQTAETRVQNVDTNKQIPSIVMAAGKKKISTIHDLFHLSQWQKTARELRAALDMYKTKGKNKGELSDETPLNKMDNVALSQDTHLKNVIIQIVREANEAGKPLTGEELGDVILKTGVALTRHTLEQLGLGHEWKVVDDPVRGKILAAVLQLENKAS